MTNEELVARIQAGAEVPENMLQLWQQTKGFIHMVALRYQGLADLEDLEQEGYLALYDAVDGYSPEKSCRFLTYAEHWMRLRMRRYIDNCCQKVRIPAHCQEKICEYRKMEKAFMAHHGRKPTEREITYSLGLYGYQLRDLESAMEMTRIGSLDSPVSDEEGSATVGDMVPCGADLEGEITEKADQDMLRAVLWPMVDCLPGRLPDVIRKRYQERMTLKEIGEAYGVNLNAIRQSELDGLRRLRRSPGARKLRAFLPEQMEPQAYRHNSVREFGRTWESSTERVALKMLEKCY